MKQSEHMMFLAPQREEVGWKPPAFMAGGVSSFRFCALALVVVGQDFRGALRMRKGNPLEMASGRRERDYQKYNRDVSRNLPHRGCGGS